MFSFDVDTTSDVPIWVQLRQRIVFLIESGVLKPGDQLPTVRGLASEISINYNTVNKAYLSLASDGYIESTRGRGAFVCDLDADATSETNEAVNLALDECIQACRDLGLSLDDVQVRMTRRIQQRKREYRMAEASPRSECSIVELDLKQHDKVKHKSHLA